MSAAGSAGPVVGEARPVVNAVGSAGPGVDEARPVVSAGSAGPAVAAGGPAVNAADAAGSGVDAAGRAVDVAGRGLRRRGLGGLLVPPGLEGLGVEFRFCDADGVARGGSGGSGVLLWDYFSPAVRGVWGEAGSVEWIHVTAAGVDTLLFDELRDSDVVVTNAHGVFDRPIAEYVLGAVIAHAKESRVSLELQRRHEWRHRETRSVLGAERAGCRYGRDRAGDGSAAPGGSVWRFVGPGGSRGRTIRTSVRSLLVAIFRLRWGGPITWYSRCR